MSVRAKVMCTRKTDFTNGAHQGATISGTEVTLQPVYAGSDEGANKSWSKYTPSGEIKLTITNPEALAQFVLGKAYYVDFTPVE